MSDAPDQTTPTPEPAPQLDPQSGAPLKPCKTKFAWRKGKGPRRVGGAVAQLHAEALREIAGATQEVGTYDAVWGTNDASVTGYGTTMSAQHVRNADEEKHPNNDGETTGLLYLDYRDEIEFEVLAQSANVLPDPGDQITACGVTGTVQKASRKWENRGWKKISVTMIAYDTLTL